MTVRNPLVLIPGGNPQIQELPAGDTIGGAPIGQTGPAGTIEIGTVTTVDSGDPATVTNVGTGTAAILDFEIPQGETGAAGGSDVVLLEQHTASASASLDFTSISGTYDTYIFEFVNIVPASSGANFLCRMGTGAGPTYDSGSNYNWATQISNSAGGTAFTGSTSSTSIEIAASCGSGSTDSLVGTMKLYEPANTSKHKRVTLPETFYANSAGALSQRSGGGSYKSTTAVTGIQFLMSTGNIATGIIRMYGIAK